MKGIKGFTLIEIIIVLAILVTIGSIAAPNFLGAYDDARVDLEQIQMQTILTGFAQAAQTMPEYTLSEDFALASLQQYLVDTSNPLHPLYMPEVTCLITGEGTGTVIYAPILDNGRLYLIGTECGLRSEDSLAVKPGGETIDYEYTVSARELFSGGTYLVIGDDENTRRGYERVFTFDPVGESYQIGTKFVLSQDGLITLPGDDPTPIVSPVIVSTRTGGWLFPRYQISVFPQSEGTTYYRVYERIGWFRWRWSAPEVYTGPFDISYWDSRRIRAYTVDAEGTVGPETELNLRRDRVAGGIVLPSSSGTGDGSQFLGENLHTGLIFDYYEDEGVPHYYYFRIEINESGSISAWLEKYEGDTRLERHGPYPLPDSYFSTFYGEQHELLLAVNNDTVSVMLDDEEIISGIALSDRGDEGQEHFIGYRMIMPGDESPDYPTPVYLWLLSAPDIIDFGEGNIIVEAPVMTFDGTTHYSLKEDVTVIIEEPQDGDEIQWKMGFDDWQTVPYVNPGLVFTVEESTRIEARILRDGVFGPSVGITFNNIVEPLMTPKVVYINWFFSRYRFFFDENELLASAPLAYPAESISLYIDTDATSNIEISTDDLERGYRSISRSGTTPSEFKAYYMSEYGEVLSEVAPIERLEELHFDTPEIEATFDEDNNEIWITLNRQWFSDTWYRLTNSSGTTGSWTRYTNPFSFEKGTVIRVEAQARANWLGRIIAWIIPVTDSEIAIWEDIEYVPGKPIIQEMPGHLLRISTEPLTHISHRVNGGEWQKTLLQGSETFINVQAANGDTVEARSIYRNGSTWSATTTYVVGSVLPPEIGTLVIGAGNTGYLTLTKNHADDTSYYMLAFDSDDISHDSTDWIEFTDTEIEIEVDLLTDTYIGVYSQRGENISNMLVERVQ